MRSYVEIDNTSWHKVFIMVYITFKESSKKHLHTCQCLIHTLESCNQEIKYLLPNILYLTGYTIETILKYRLFVNLNYDRNQDIKDVDISIPFYTIFLLNNNPKFRALIEKNEQKTKEINILNSG